MLNCYQYNFAAVMWMVALMADAATGAPVTTYERVINRAPNGEPLIKLVRGGQPIDIILSEISKQAGVPIEARGPEATKLKLTIIARDEPLMSVLKGIAEQNALILYSPESEARYILYDRETYLRPVIGAGSISRQHFRNVSQAEFVVLEPVLHSNEGGLLTELGTFTYHPTSATLGVEDLPEYLVEIKDYIEWLRAPHAQARTKNRSSGHKANFLIREE